MSDIFISNYQGCRLELFRTDDVRLEMTYFVASDARRQRFMTDACWTMTSRGWYIRPCASAERPSCTGCRLPSADKLPLTEMLVLKSVIDALPILRALLGVHGCMRCRWRLKKPGDVCDGPAIFIYIYPGTHFLGWRLSGYHAFKNCHISNGWWFEMSYTSSRAYW